MKRHFLIACIIFLICGFEAHAQAIDSRFEPIGVVSRDPVQNTEDVKTLSINISGDTLRKQVSAGTVVPAFWDQKAHAVTIDPDVIRTVPTIQQYAEAVVLRDSRIKNLSVNERTMLLTYRMPGKLFGLIAVDVSGSIEVGVPLLSEKAAANVRVTYPWYHVFIKKNIRAKRLSQEILAQADLLNSATDVQHVAQYLHVVSTILLSSEGGEGET